MLKADTVEQYHLLNYVKDNFCIDEIEVLKVSKNKIKVADKLGKSLYFKYEGGKVKVEAVA